MNPSYIDYSIDDLKAILEIKFFANVSTSSILDSMDCHVNGNKNVCLNMESRKCDMKHEEKLVSEKPDYFNCMNDAFNKIHGKN